VTAEITAWQSRPLEPMYPVIFFDALRVKLRDDAVVRNKAVYPALGVLPDGTPDVLGMWIEQTEGAKFWLKVFNDLRTRGVNDIPIAVVDGPKGLAEAVEVAFPQTTVQSCIVHLIRNSFTMRAGRTARRSRACTCSCARSSRRADTSRAMSGHQADVARLAAPPPSPSPQQHRRQPRGEIGIALQPRSQPLQRNISSVVGSAAIRDRVRGPFRRTGPGPNQSPVRSVWAAAGGKANPAPRTPARVHPWSLPVLPTPAGLWQNATSAGSENGI